MTVFYLGTYFFKTHIFYISTSSWLPWLTIGSWGSPQNLGAKTPSSSSIQTRLTLDLLDFGIDTRDSNLTPQT